MAVKYTLQYKDSEEILHEVDVFDDNYTGDSIEVNGRVFLDFSQTKDTLEPLRGSGIKVELEAGQDLDFSDLYSEQERTFKVNYYRNNTREFQGFLTSEGFYESYVNQNWNVTFECLDGLGFLDTLAFVDDDGKQYKGRMTMLDVLIKALSRTGISKGFLIDIDTGWLGMDFTQCVLAKTLVLAERYIKSDNETVMSCKDVVKDILSTFNAVLVSKGEDWVISKPNRLYKSTTRPYFSYSSQGLIEGVVNVNMKSNLGSNVNGFYPCHAGANQNITFIGSLGVYRIDYDYGLRNSLLPNSNFFSANGTTADGWNVIQDVTFNAQGYGAIIDADSDGSIVDNLTSEPVGVLQENIFSLDFSYSVQNVSIGEYFGGRAYFQVVLTDGNETYYLKNDGGWSNSSDAFSFDFFNDSGNFGFEEIQPLPIDGNLTITIRTPLANEYPLEDQQGNTTFERVRFDMVFESVSLTTFATGESNSVGETHTFQRTINPNPKKVLNKEVFTGDEVSDLYKGTIYKSTGENTSQWKRFDVSEAKPILRIMGEETMRQYAKPTRYFSGDIYGFLPYEKVVQIDGISALFMFCEYSYDTKNNTISGKLREILGSEITDLDYKKTEKGSNIITPTITS